MGAYLHIFFLIKTRLTKPARPRYTILTKGSFSVTLHVTASVCLHQLGTQNEHLRSSSFSNKYLLKEKMLGPYTGCE